MTIIAAFLGGLLGSAHCLGMCGGFAVTLGSLNQSRWPMVSRQLLYTLGRIFTYSFLGAVGGFCGLYLSQFKTPLVNMQQAFSIFAGMIMLLVGLSVFNVIQIRWSALPVVSLFAPLFSRFFVGSSGWSFFSAGLANGFLPCGLVYSFLALSVSTGSLWEGATFMASFGLGTAPAMLAIGCGAHWLHHQLRLRIYRLAGAVVILMGLITIWRSLPSHRASCHTACYPIKINGEVSDCGIVFA